MPTVGRVAAERGHALPSVGGPTQAWQSLPYPANPTDADRSKCANRRHRSPAIEGAPTRQAKGAPTRQARIDPSPGQLSDLLIQKRRSSQMIEVAHQKLTHLRGALMRNIASCLAAAALASAAMAQEPDLVGGKFPPAE